MTREHAAFRPRMATGFLSEATQDVSLGRWRSAVDNARLAAENGVKAVLSLTGPVGRTHAPTVPLREAFARGGFHGPGEPRLRGGAQNGELRGLPRKRSSCSDQFSTNGRWSVVPVFEAGGVLRAFWLLVRSVDGVPIRLTSERWDDICRRRPGLGD